MSHFGHGERRRHQRFNGSRATHSRSGFDPAAPSDPGYGLYIDGSQIGAWQLPPGGVNDGTIDPGGLDGDESITPGTITYTPFADTVRPVGIVDALPALPDGDYPPGACVVLTTDGKLYRNDADVWTTAVPVVDLDGQIDTDLIADNAVTLQKFYETSRPVEILSEVAVADNLLLETGDALLLETGDLLLLETSVGSGTPEDSLPALPDADYPPGALVFNPVDGKVYRNVEDAWARTVDGGDLVARSVTALAIEAEAITANEIAAATILGDRIAANTITSDNILANTITAAEISAGAIGATEIAAEAISTSHFAADAVIALVTNDGASVVIDEDGITITDGALEFVDAYGSTVLSGAGFGGSWLDFLQSRVYNGNWRAAPPTPGSDITPGEGSANQVPSWNFVEVSGTAIDARWIADSSAPVGGYMKLTMAAGAASDEAVFEQYIPVSPSKSQVQNLVVKATFEVDTAGTAANARAIVRRQFYKADGVTTTGPEVTGTMLMSSLAGLDPWTVGTAVLAIPADAGFVRLRVGLQRNTALTSQTCAVRIYEVYTMLGETELYFTDQSVPSNPPGSISNNNGQFRLGALDVLELDAGDYVWVVSSRLDVAGEIKISNDEDTITVGQDNYNPEVDVWGNGPTSIWAITPSGASRQITGIDTDGTVSGGELRYIYNPSTSFDIVLKHENASSSAGNRFVCPGAADYSVTPLTGVMVFYLNGRWRVMDK